VIELSLDQRQALNNLLAWFSVQNKTPFITLGGYAGTGKTTLISLLRNELHRLNPKLKVAFCSYTGKASRVLKFRIGESQASYENDFIGTIHSLIYSPIEDEKTQEIVGWELKKNVEADLIIIDEASMVDYAIWQDLLSFKIPIIATGDHGQLPPIKENFNLMERPILKLEEIHRQARGNPIVQLSIMARKEGKIPIGNFGKNIKKISTSDTEGQEEVSELLQNYKENTLILCGYNRTRVKLNNYIRSFFGFEAACPQSGDRVICLRNNRAKEVFNGMLGKVLEIQRKDEIWYEAEIAMDGEEEIYQGLISVDQFNKIDPMNFTRERYRIVEGDLFDFGYALTVHKAQGSQAERVVLFEERFNKMTDEEWRRWLYTGITRAEKELFIVGS
jgi:exodeoxyribonuclease-5